jgi:trans-aconitate methyltransferase
MVRGVDPDARMAALARSMGVDVEVAKFEEWDAGDRTFDAIIAAQAWHWVNPVAGAAKAAAVLRPAVDAYLVGCAREPGACR